MTADTCGGCHRPMLRSHRRRPGYQRHAADGICHNCYGRRYDNPHHVLSEGFGTRGRPTWLDQYADWVKVERAIAGQRVNLNSAEITDVVTQLTERGMSGRDIALHIGVSYRTVVRARARHRAQQETAA